MAGATQFVRATSDSVADGLARLRPHVGRMATTYASNWIAHDRASREASLARLDALSRLLNPYSSPSMMRKSRSPALLNTLRAA